MHPDAFGSVLECPLVTDYFLIKLKTEEGPSRFQPSNSKPKTQEPQMFLERAISDDVGVPDHLTLFEYEKISIEMVKLATCHSKLA
jgi:hypothetical protein